ncbi:hypothetical protein EC396_04150 [Lutibacter sp. HS1-25]|uniref:hypothetical protein n=1 Tax=Lutibacter sp. HS1-25 TaxID=2485000 RepID=UPI001012EC5C|nr:hypothetical protein [Lutibacter sp. HS1-25]RXP61393.1 hypothetical protein EC396_04150 [Lutibacter sp. HS1-25]
MNDTSKIIISIVLSIIGITLIFGMIASTNIDLGIGNLFLALGVVIIVFALVFTFVDSTADKIEEKITNNSIKEAEETISKKSRLNKNIYSSLQKYVNEVNINDGYKVINDKVIKTDGFYIACKSGYNSEIGITFQIFFALVFNKNGYVIYLENENEFNISNEEISEFIDLNECDKLGDISKYSIDGNQIFMKFYESEDPKSYEEDIIHPNYFKELRGVVKRDLIVVDYYKSGFNYALQDYENNKVIDSLKFKFIEFKK